MNSVKMVTHDAALSRHMSEAGDKLVVLYYTASWCKPCAKFKSVYEDLSLKYPTVVFLKSDVEKSQELAMEQDVTEVPTFIFFKNGVRVDVVRGSDTTTLKKKIAHHAGKRASEESTGKVKTLDPSSTSLVKSKKSSVETLVKKPKPAIKADAEKPIQEVPKEE